MAYGKSHVSDHRSASSLFVDIPILTLTISKLGKIFSREHTDFFFLFLPEKSFLTFHARRQFA